MPTGYLKEQYETTPGNETSGAPGGSKLMYMPIQSATPHLGANPMERDDELRNIDEPISVLTDIYAPSWEFSSRMYPDTLGWRLKHILGAPVTTAGDGIITDLNGTVIPAGGPIRHTWTAPFGPAGVSPITTEQIFAYKDQTTFFKNKGSACDTLGIESPEAGGSMITASGPTNYQARIADPSLTPAYETLAIRPFTRTGLTLPTWLASTSTHANFGIGISNPVEPFRSMGIASKFPDVMEKANAGPITVAGTLDQRQLGTADWDAMLGATGFSAKAQWISETIIAGGYAYKLIITMSNCQYVGGEVDALQNIRRHGAQFQWKSTTPSAGSTVVQLVNATASYA